VLVNRAPLLTRAPTTFERAYYAYQQRVQRALHNPFPAEFYFKRGSPLEAKFNMEERARERRAFGRVRADGGGAAPEGEEAAEAGAVEMTKEFEEEVQEAGRWNKADAKKDTKSLDRAGQRNLYLLILKKEQDRQRWVFPQRRTERGELLHQVRSSALTTLQLY
jgi:large subunit ribosomal protein L46